MIGTEKALWRSLSKASEPRDLLTRIETGETASGVSDIEYVFRHTGRHGWVELKTFSTDRNDKPITLHTPFTFGQASWLLAHNIPEQKLFSYLLLGRLGPRTWREMFLVPADIAVTKMMMKRRPLTVDLLMAARTTLPPYRVLRCADAREVLGVLRSV